jgi:hypothetical protein
LSQKAEASQVSGGFLAGPALFRNEWNFQHLSEERTRVLFCAESSNESGLLFVCRLLGIPFIMEFIISRRPHKKVKVKSWVFRTKQSRWMLSMPHP